MLLQAGLARLALPVERAADTLGELRTVRQVVDAHAQHRKQYGPKDLGASWNTLGKLVRRPDERRVLRSTPKILQPLAEHTEQALPKFDARPLANTVNGLASLHASKGWRASDALWAGLATHCTRSVATMNAHDLSSTALGFATVGRGTWLCDPALLDAIAEEVAQRGLREFKPQNLGYTAWAYFTRRLATLRCAQLRKLRTQLQLHRSAHAQPVAEGGYAAHLIRARRRKLRAIL